MEMCRKGGEVPMLNRQIPEWDLLNGSDNIEKSRKEKKNTVLFSVAALSLDLGHCRSKRNNTTWREAGTQKGKNVTCPRGGHSVTKLSFDEL